MQTITTKYLPATNNNGSRIKATTSSGISATIGYPHELSGVQCHMKAVHEVNKKLNWSGQMVAGGTKDGDYIFVFVEDDKIVLMPEEK